MNKELLETIQNWLKTADAIVINTGAGMGVDSGLADYRGSGGQWGNVEIETGESVFYIMNPKSLIDRPDYIWKLFVARIRAYSETTPHQGFYILKKWIEQFQLNYFVTTSNVDGHFQKASFDELKIRELHGSILYFQCGIPCNKQIWKIKLDLQQFEDEVNTGSYLKCPNCGKMARPNIYMFRDNTFLPDRDNEQKQRFNEFLEQNKGKSIVVFEIGSGPHVQSIRKNTRMLGLKYNAKIVRINPKDSKIRKPHIGIGRGALEALTKIDSFLSL